MWRTEWPSPRIWTNAVVIKIIACFNWWYIFTIQWTRSIFSTSLLARHASQLHHFFFFKAVPLNVMHVVDCFPLLFDHFGHFLKWTWAQSTHSAQCVPQLTGIRTSWRVWLESRGKYPSRILRTRRTSSSSTAVQCRTRNRDFWELNDTCQMSMSTWWHVATHLILMRRMLSSGLTSRWMIYWHQWATTCLI